MAAVASMIAEKVLNVCCTDGANATSTEQNASKIDPHFKKKFLNQDMKFEMTEWKKLPPKAKKACESLGYDEEKWDKSEEVDVSWKHWWDLTAAEKESLEILGWEETAWESQYQWTEWNDLPKLQKKAAKAAGYTEDNWQDWVEGLDKWWDDLGEEEKKAMCVMGWTKAKWDDS
mmetsp:Transcript_314/g.554  ORF Transcript_314/g.554 Transcript_314/m.554 type:complete len:174 (+) Transcript_314:138-659(+)